MVTAEVAGRLFGNHAGIVAAFVSAVGWTLLIVHLRTKGGGR
jgi:hypothetical protein